MNVVFPVEYWSKSITMGLASKSFFVGLGTKSRHNSESETHLQKEYGIGLQFKYVSKWIKIHVLGLKFIYQ